MNSPVEQAARQLALRSEWRNKGDDHNQSGIDQKFRDLGDPANVLYAVGFSEPKIAVKPMANIIAVKDVGVLAVGVQTLFQQVGDRRLARTRKSREPQAAGLLMLHFGAGGFGDFQRLPMDVHRAAQRKTNDAGADGLVGQLVDDDKRAQPLVLAIGRKRHGPIETHVDRGDFVQA